MEYYILIDGKTEGPFSLEKLKEMPVTPQTKVWRQGMPEWIPAGEVGELNFLFGTPPPAPVENNSNHEAEPASVKIAPRTWLVESILITVLCCLPFGIVGIVYASKVSSLLKLTIRRSHGCKQRGREVGEDRFLYGPHRHYPVHDYRLLLHIRIRPLRLIIHQCIDA